MKIGFMGLFVCICLLTACGRSEGYRDLRNYIDQLRINYAFTGKLNKSNAVHKVVVVEYKKGAARSPFDEGNNSPGKTASNPLSAYAVSVLRFVGTVSEENKVWAYITTPDNKVYKITEGDKIGDHDGIVKKITSKQIEILEQQMDEDKQDSQRIITLQLKEEG